MRSGEALAQAIAEAMTWPDVVSSAQSMLAECRKLGLVSDWEGCAKVDDFAALLVAAARHLPPGGSIETGVHKGGTAGPLLWVAAPESFHVSIDPYGVPGQSYSIPSYGDWAMVRHTTAVLAWLAQQRRVTFCPYLTDSLTFIKADLLRHPGTFRFVHLDGDHSEEAVRAELDYFRPRAATPALFILDDHDEHFPGVDAALGSAGQGLIPILHRFYDFPNYGVAGFSAWLHVA